MGTVSNGDFRTFWKELFQEKDPTQVGIHHSPWGSEWDNGCQYYVFIVSGTKLSLTIEHNEYNLGRKTKLQIQARSFKPQYLCTFYLKALYKEKGIVSQFIYGGVGGTVGSGHQWAISEMKQREISWEQNIPLQQPEGAVGGGCNAGVQQCR